VTNNVMKKISMGSLNCKSELQFISSVKEESEDGRCVSMNSACVDLLDLDMNFSTSTAQGCHCNP
jgi:hypothetical protein